MMAPGEDVKEHPLSSQFEFLTLIIPVKCPHVTVVSMNRPLKRNAINAKMWREIGTCFDRLGTLGDGCRCILLTGSGKAFCAGIDVSDPSLFPQTTSTLEEIGGAGDVEDVAHRGLAFLPKILEMQRCFTAVETCPIPVIAAIHGSCIGAGVDLACCCDVRICSSNSIFSIREVRVGLAADIGTLQRLPKIVGNDSLVRELCLTGGNFNSSEASRIGFVSRVVDNELLLEQSLKLCNRISSNSPVAVRGTKRSLVYSRDHTVSDGLEQIATHNALALMTNDLGEAFAAAASKSTPTFQNIPPFSRL